MEVAIANNQTTTNTASADNSIQQQQHSLSGVRSPFQREVREWQRIDPATGALLTGRLEADRWINGPLHSYGKKSSSSVSSNSNSSTANMLNFTSSNNNSNNRSTHSSGSKVSLHTIVGSNNNNSNGSNATLLSTSSSTTSSLSTAAKASTAWQRQQQQQQQKQAQQQLKQPHQRHSQLLEQLPTFGKINSGTDFVKSRVGEAVTGADDRAEAKFDDRVTFNRTATTTTTDERNTLQLTPTHLQRRNLESFRHYNENDNDDRFQHHHHRHYHNDDRGDQNTKNIKNDNVDVNEDNDADMRLSKRHQRRQQLPDSSTSLTSINLHRGRSISTDDLSTEWDPQSDDTTIDEPGEWKRVSKLRRSFQSPATTRSTTSDSTAPPRRPLDLPTSSVSVSKIRAELEQGRRLNTAMRNNNVDMAALQSILNPTASSTADTKPVTAARSTFLTADSLKEIRNNLKKLSDESLYKEDFLLHQTAPVEHLEIHEVKTKPVIKTQLHRITPERSADISNTTPSAFKLVVAQKQSSPPAVSFSSPQSKQHTTHSLESRQKYRDTTSAEWHLRRKSYGFEKMLPTEESNMFRMDASTDSGLGRSSELNAWSPTETVPSTHSTVVHFGESARVTGLLQRRYQHKPNSPETGSSSDEQKRHSIAFDDSQFGRKSSQVRINGVGLLESESTSQPHSYDTDSPTNGSSATQYFQRSQQKRVEFCKTEVHFAAESGRVNIVETDGKPPPTNNFRRRRRTTSGPLQSLVKGASSTSDSLTSDSKTSVALPITRFGDENRPRTLASTTVAYKATLMDSNADAYEPSNVTITLPKISEGLGAGSRNSYASTSGIDTTDNENDDIAGIRGILKNKPVKPKPYHLGENFETPDALWGVQLKPVGGQQLRKESVETVTTRDSPPLQVLNKSVAERVHNVEKRQEHSSAVQHSGYSTKINLSLNETTPEWNEQDIPNSNVMSIALHSPQATLEKTQPQATPVARSRTTTDSATKEPLRIIKEARGARKLREHELSFFGVPVANTKASSNTTAQSSTTTTTSTKRTLPQRQRFREETTLSTRHVLDPNIEENFPSSKWKLTHDRPDLLHHTEYRNSSQMAKDSQPKKKSFSPVKHIQYSDEEEDTETEHFYENLTNDPDAKPPKSQCMSATKAYSRQRDLARDERILSEMTHTADQTMKALNDEAALKDQRRRSLTRRNSKPLETIDEKSMPEKINDKCIAVTVTRSTLASEAKRQTSHVTRQAVQSPSAHSKLSRTRTSSQSSGESGSRPRSRSLSSEREYEQTHAKLPVRSVTKHSRQTKATSRSSSRDSQRSSQTLGSSGDELCRRDERLRAKTKRSLSSALTKTSTEKSRMNDHEQREREKIGERSQQRSSRSSRELHRGENSSKSKSKSTTRSSKRECVECVTDISRTPPPQPASRRHRGESDKRSSSASRHAGTAVDKLEARSSLRLVRSMRSSQDPESSQRSSNRSERSISEKEKLSRSKGHSSRSAADRCDSSKQRHQQEHHGPSHSASPSGTSRIRNSSEHRKSANATAASVTADNTQTHSKNASALSGISAQRSHHHHRHHHSHHTQQPTQHIHSLTAATIATKQRERRGKDRK